MAYPYALSYSQYEGFLLFLDRYPMEPYVTLRQLHIPTFTISTIYSLAYNINLDPNFHPISLTDRILLSNGALYAAIKSSTLPCPASFTSLEGSAPNIFSCVPCPQDTFSTTSNASLGCRPCSKLTCLAGQMLIPCQPTQDAYCQPCTNKPDNAIYTLQNQCTWVYKYPCPATYYSDTVGSSARCTPCPPFSTTTLPGAVRVTSCKCLQDGTRDSTGTCVIPSPFKPPQPCDPLTPCTIIPQPPFPFQILQKCTLAIQDSPAHICPCDPGSYIAQIYPKICLPCPPGLLVILFFT